ncbi:MAG: hypothetical protein JO048_04430 [Methylobacteriaceae bacterium]|nr:hypothetical protein [Methylobacteriaceae bacterium]
MGRRIDDTKEREQWAPVYRSIVRRIGVQLRSELGNPESEPLPAAHVDLLLQLRHKERNAQRGGSA